MPLNECSVCGALSTASLDEHAHTDWDNCIPCCAIDLDTTQSTWDCPRCAAQWTHQRDQHAWTRSAVV